MLITLMLAGAFAPGQIGPGLPVITPPGRIIALPGAAANPVTIGSGLPMDTAIAAETMDPRDLIDFVLNLAPLLDTGERFSSLALAVVPASVARGFNVVSAAPYSPAELTDSSVRIWVTVDDAKRLDSGWSATGQLCAIEVTATTNSQPPRIWQRTAAIRVQQK